MFDTQPIIINVTNLTDQEQEDVEIFNPFDYFTNKNSNPAIKLFGMEKLSYERIIYNFGLTEAKTPITKFHVYSNQKKDIDLKIDILNQDIFGNKAGSTVEAKPIKKAVQKNASHIVKNFNLDRLTIISVSKLKPLETLNFWFYPERRIMP